ncbi:MAG: XdhC family protein [Gemmatimonadaceae bacterium]
MPRVLAHHQHLYAECARLAAGAGRGALATVARRRGSLPMSRSAKMLVTADGARMGTVGGGCLEAEIVERALSVAGSGQPALTAHTLTAELAGDYGLTCGGRADMFIEPVYSDPTLALVHAECAALLARGERAVVVTSLDWTAGVRKLLVVARDRADVGVGTPAMREAAALLGPASEEPLLRLADGDDAHEAGNSVAVLRDGRPGAALLVEPLVGPPRLVVFGGGHVGASVAEAAAFAGWRVTVVDDRAEFADPARLPFAERTLVCDFGALPPTLGIDAGTYVVVATRGHQHDALVVDQVARGDVRYLGMLGSRRKVALTWRMLEGWGVPGDRLAHIHAPVGLPIGADTPEEIAVSVVAEMIAVRREGSRRRGGTGAARPAPALDTGLDLALDAAPERDE